MEDRNASRPAFPERDAVVIEHLAVLRAQLGDPEAFTLLFDRYHDRALAYVRRLVGSVMDAEDILQEVWIVVVRRISTLKEPSAFRAWLYRIARNKAISRLRWRRRQPDMEDFGSAATIAAISKWQGDDEPIPGGFDPEAVGRAMAGLSDAHREVLTLRYFEDFSYEEIASIIGRSLGTVRSRIHYATKALELELRSAVDGSRMERIQHPDKGENR